MGYHEKPLIMEVEKNYNWNILKFEKYKKGWLLKTSEGLIYLKSMNSSEDELLFSYSIYNHFKCSDFHHLLDLYKTKEEKPYLRLSDKLYQAYKWEKFDKVKYKNAEELKEVVKVMTAFHQASIGFKTIPGSKVKTEWGRWIWVFQSYCNFANQYKKLLIDKRNKEKIEKTFLENFDDHYAIGLQSIQWLKETPYLDIVKKSMEKNELCIHNVSPKNFLKVKGNRYVIQSLEHAKHDIRVIDVADLILQNIEDIEKIKQILTTYHERIPLTRDELKIIKAYIQFPQAYFKSIEKFYRSKTNISHNNWHKKMKKVIRFEKAKKSFIDLSLQEVVYGSDRV